MHLLFSLLLLARAQSVKYYQEDNMFEYVAAIIVQNQPPSDISHVAKDSIQGNCFFEGSSCNGAEVSLFDDKGKLLDRQNLLSSNIPSFSFAKLKSDKTYKLTINYDRYHARGEIKGVKTGILLFIEITKQPSSSSKVDK